MKTLIKLLVLLGVLAVALFFAKDVVLKTALEQSIKYATGFRAEAQSVHAEVLLDRVIHIKGLIVYNPPGFDEPILLDAPEIRIRYDLASMFRPVKRFEEVRLHIKKVRVVQSQRGELNLDILKFIRKQRQRPEEVMRSLPRKSKQEIFIRKLILKLDKVEYKDYIMDPPDARTFDVAINERFYEIARMEDLFRVIAFRALTGSPVTEFVDFDPLDMGKPVKTVLATGVNALGEGIIDLKKGLESIGGAVRGMAE